MSISGTFRAFLQGHPILEDVVYRTSMLKSVQESAIAPELADLRKLCENCHCDPSFFNQEDWELLERGFNKILEVYFSGRRGHNYGELANRIKEDFRHEELEDEGIQIRLIPYGEIDTKLITPPFQYTKPHPVENGLLMMRAYGLDINKDFYAFSLGKFADRPEAQINTLLDDIELQKDFFRRVYRPEEDLVWYRCECFSLYNIKPANYSTIDKWEQPVMEITTWTASRNKSAPEFIALNLERVISNFFGPLPYCLRSSHTSNV